MVDRYIRPVGQRTPPPDGLREAAAAGTAS
jgi:hypothetical protein